MRRLSARFPVPALARTCFAGATGGCIKSRFACPRYATAAQTEPGGPL